MWVFHPPNKNHVYVALNPCDENFNDKKKKEFNKLSEEGSNHNFRKLLVNLEKSYPSKGAYDMDRYKRVKSKFDDDMDFIKKLRTMKTNLEIEFVSC